MKPPSIGSLRSILEAAGIDRSRWSAPFKTIEDLDRELRLGESEISVDPLVRRVRTAALVVTSSRGTLRELERVTSAGSLRREHSYSLLEKLHRDEPFEAGAIRCLAEELGVPEHDAMMLVARASRDRVVEELESPLYPGLPLHNELVVFRVELPERLVRPRYEERSGDATIVWCWEP